MNTWIDFLRNKIVDDKENVETLINIDNNIMGTKLKINDLISFLNKEKNNNNFFNLKLSNNPEIIIEGNPKATIKVLSDIVNKSGTLVLGDSFLGINSWLMNQYRLYVKSNGLSNIIKPIYEYYFSTKLGNVTLIGSEYFINELSDCIDGPYMAYLDNNM